MTVNTDGAKSAATPPKRPRPAKEPILTAAVDVARAAVEEFLAPNLIGEHQGVQIEDNRLVTHYFATKQPGYVGWQWAVTLARVPRGRRATVCEVALLPGEGAKLPPRWVPWAERLEPEDVSPTDVLPYEAEDVRLVPGFTDTSEDADQLDIDELGLGRVRVLSPEGFDRAATRWYEGDHGPNTPGARATRSKCATCGFFMKLAGTPRRMFGVCGNEWSPDDGRVVSVDHGCGAHSETDVPYRPPLWNPPAVVMDEGEMEHFELQRREKPSEEAPEELAEKLSAEETPTEEAEAEKPADEVAEDTMEEPNAEAAEPESGEELEIAETVAGEAGAAEEAGAQEPEVELAEEPEGEENTEDLTEESETLKAEGDSETEEVSAADE